MKGEKERRKFPNGTHVLHLKMREFQSNLMTVLILWVP